MNKTVLTALKGSINKWEKILHKNGEDRGGWNCPLCDIGCYRCPIFDETNSTCCVGTPYKLWSEHHHEKHRHYDDHIRPRKIRCKKCKELAKAELKFLKSLLPKQKVKI